MVNYDLGLKIAEKTFKDVYCVQQYWNSVFKSIKYHERWVLDDKLFMSVSSCWLLTATEVSHLRDASALLLSGRHVFGMAEDDIIFSSSFFLPLPVLDVSVASPSLSLPSATLSLQGLNLCLLSIADQFEPVFREALFVSHGISGLGHVELWCHVGLGRPWVSFLNQLYKMVYMCLCTWFQPKSSIRLWHCGFFLCSVIEMYSSLCL